MHPTTDERKSPVISVIIPVYNVEDYLGACLDSIRKQTYRNLDILLINDGSTDKSPEICGVYAKDDSRIRIVHQENNGLAYTRNQGVKNAIGSYILFVDSDDVLREDHYIETLFHALQKYDASIAISDMPSFLDGRETMPKDETPNVAPTLFSAEEAIRASCYNQPFGLSACGRLCEANLYQGITFPEGKLYEDFATFYRVLDHAKQVVFVPSVHYDYRIRNGSTMRCKLKPYIGQFALDQYEYIQKNRPACLNDEKVICCTTLFLAAADNWEEMSRETKDHYRSFIRNEIFSVLENPKAPLHIKVKLAFFAIWPSFIVFVRRTYGRVK